MSFGFTLNNPVIGFDDTAFDIYFDDKLLIAQGRFGPAILNEIFHIYTFNPFFLDFCAVICLFISAIMFCVLFKIVSNDKLHPISYTIFACFMISYPLMSEIFCYMTASFTICISYLIVALTLILMNYLIKNRKFLCMVIPTFLLVLIISSYESFATVYICGVFAVLIIKYMFGEEKDKFAKTVIKNGLIYAAPLILGIIIEATIADIITAIMKITPNPYAADDIYYSAQGFGKTFLSMLKELVVKFGLNGLWYIPITMYVISVFVTFIMMIVNIIKHRKPIILLLYFGLGFSTIMLSFIQGKASPYRTCQVFAIFIAFIMMLLAQYVLSLKIPIIKYVTVLVLFLMVFYQAKDLHKCFYNDYIRYTEEKNIYSAVSDRLNNNDFDITKPIVFTGTLSLHCYEDLDIYTSSSGRRLHFANKVLKLINYDIDLAGKKFVETNIETFFNWGKIAFAPKSQIHKFLRMNGYYYNTPTTEMIEKANEYAPNMEKWPSKNSVLETDELIIVNF
jgi:hypothetical protein